MGRLASVLLFTLLLLAGCVGSPATLAEREGAPAASPAAESTAEAIEEAATAAPADEAGMAAEAEAMAARVLTETVTLDVLSLAGNGDTFLTRIDDEIGQRGSPDAHQRVESLTSDGMVWQGEALRYGDAQIVLLQQAQAGSETAIRIQAPAEADLAAILAARDLPTHQPLYAAHPEIQFVRARMADDGTWSFDVTLTYPDRGWDDYADGWQIETPGGAILGTRILLHPHVEEQPFTRSLANVAIPADVDAVIVRSHNLVSGYAPETVRLPIGEAGVGKRYEVMR